MIVKNLHQKLGYGIFNWPSNFWFSGSVFKFEIWSPINLMGLGKGNSSINKTLAISFISFCLPKKKLTVFERVICSKSSNFNFTVKVLPFMFLVFNLFSSSIANWFDNSITFWFSITF